MRYAHTNLVARDWQALASFYQQVFSCRFQPPERNQSGDWLSIGTGVPRAALRGVHLLLPGHGDRGPTLEIYEYAESVPNEGRVANREGLGHLAFEVDSVEATAKQVLRHGGALAGAIVQRDVPGVGVLTFVYTRDPEGNLIELQSWEHQPA